jgi:hypothetical protein
MTFKIIRPQTIAETTEFSRASTATYYDADGVLQTAAIDEPRLSYDPSDLDAPPTWLFEDAATNLFVRSQEFDNASWGKSGAAVTANAAIAPDGTMTADFFYETAINAEHFLEQGEDYLVGNQYVASCHIKDASGNRNFRIRLSPVPFGGTAPIVTFNPQTSEITSFGPVADYGVIELPNGGFRLWLLTEAVTVFSINASNRLYLINGASASYLGDGVSGVYIWGAQLEITRLTSYIPTVAAAVTRAADIPGAMLTSSIAEDDYPEYNAGSTYALGDRVISTTTHRVYESLQAGNTGQPLPAANVVSTEWWLNVSATNRWKMFDNSITSQSTATDVLATAIETVGRVDSVALLNASGRSARIIMEDDTEGVVYDQTYSLIDDSGITDYYEYFFEPVTSVPNFSVQDLPLYANSLVSVIVENEGGVVAIGALVVGLSRTFGITELGASLGITDYSVKITDDFGNKTVLERAFNDRMEIQVYVENAGLDAAKIALASYRATAIVYIGSSMYGSMIQYGFFNDFNFVIAYPTYSVLNIEIEGLT